MLKNLVGDKAFYKHLLALMLPIMIQNGITNFVNMLDNIMIGTVGTAQMTGVSITNQLFFIFNLCIFGAVSGAGIFGAQYFGKQDYEGVRYTFRFKLLFSGLLTLMGIVLLTVAGRPLLQLYMQGEQGVTDPAITLSSAESYMRIMLIGFVPFALVQCYSSTLREGGKPTLPMIAGVVAVLVNLVANYILIFGHFGAPAMGVNGAAVATVISRFVELGVVVIGTHTNRAGYSYMAGVYRTLYVPGKLASRFFIKGLPLMLNETIWALGTATVNQCYSVRGLDIMAANNINSTFWSVFSIAFLAVGAAVGIVLGQMLGSNQLKEAKVACYRLMTFSGAVCVVMSVLYVICAPYIPLAYNTEQSIRELATQMMIIGAVFMPFDAVTHSAYFAMRSGGKMFTTFLFDCGTMWCVNVPLAFVLTRYTALPFVAVYAILQAIVVGKSIAGVLLVRSGFWIRNIVAKPEE